jgi:hypothetical protein
MAKVARAEKLAPNQSWITPEQNLFGLTPAKNQSAIHS